MHPGTTAKVVLLGAAVMITGCAADSSLLEHVMITPGYFETLSCADLATQLRATTDRVRELTMLMERSADNPAGPIVNALAYNTEYAKARARQRNAEAAAASKGCDRAQEPTGPPATPAVIPEVATPAH